MHASGIIRRGILLSLLLVSLLGVGTFSGCGLFDEELPPARVPKDLTGSWKVEGGGARVTLEMGGFYRFSSGGREIMRGRVIYITDDQFTVENDEDAPCGHITGIYSYQLIGDQLTVTMIRDYCPERVNNWPGVWQRNSSR